MPRASNNTIDVLGQSATESQKGVQRNGTQEEVSAGLLDTVTVTPKTQLGKVAQFQDQKPTGTQGGSTSNNTTYIRELNTDVINQIPGCVRSGNNITLLAGTYLFEIDVPSLSTGVSSAWIERVSGELFDPINSIAADLANQVTQTEVIKIRQIRTFTGTIEFCIKHFTANGRSTNGLGRNYSPTTGLTVNEVYTTATITQLG